MTEITQGIYDAIEHYVLAGDFRVDSMSIINGHIYMTIEGKDYVISIKGVKL